jgi:serine/threonine protein kinase
MQVKGGFGKVYKAIHNTTSKVRAIKMIEKDNKSLNNHRKILQEIDILKQLVSY